MLHDFFRKGYSEILAAGITWGTIGLFVTMLGSAGIASSSAAFLRIFAGAVIIGILIITKKGLPGFYINGKGLTLCIILGICSQGMFNYCYNASIANTGMATASILLYTAPVFVLIMSAVFFSEKITMVKSIALFLNVAGCILTVAGGSIDSMQFSAAGVLFGIAAGFLYALMTIVSKTTTDDYDPLSILFYSFIFGSVFLALVIHPFDDIAASWNFKTFLLALGYGAIPTALSYKLYMSGLSKKPETSKVPVIASVETVAAAMIGIIVFREDISVPKAAGIFLVLVSIFIMNMRVSSSKKILRQK